MQVIDRGRLDQAMIQTSVFYLGGSSSINSTHRRGTKGLMWGARGPFRPAAAMFVMVVVGSWSLGRISTVGIVYFFYGINLFFGLNI